ncbi:hypothetical protein BJ508DRAFT_151258 [Ascobolus immersus RN42]|uniref:Pinin/SDK/MemA protein domain-containing protein n=1 Tax=Ascobolus immersus RN42 TaxID=1160509 RepID=A0A3N4I2Q6_ASCIM|nr:hypothetical protein BJ508DRAFT_151258 [Ascobolus immersus RN42]
MGRDYETKVAIPSRVNVPRSPSPRPRKRYASSESRSPSPPARYRRRSPSPERRRERRRSRSPRSPRRRSTVRERSPPPRRGRSPVPPARIEPAPRRRVVDAVEKTRNKRLFGGILGTLSKFQSDLEKPKVKAGNARRRELEEKAREKLKRGIPVDENRAAKRRTGPEWRAWEKHCMDQRHTNLRHQARFLKTTTEPHLYYIPWKLTKSNQAQLDKQLAEVEEVIAREIDQLAKKHEEEEALEKGISLPNRQAEPAQAAPISPVDRDHSPMIAEKAAEAINNEDVEMNLDTTDDQNHESNAETPSLEDKETMEHDKKSANGAGQAESKDSLDNADEDLRDASFHSTKEQQENNETDKEMTTEEEEQPSTSHEEQRQQSPKEEEVIENDDADMVE